jgi:peroxiredoxin
MPARIELNQPAPDFSLADTSGSVFQLSDMFGLKNVVLVFNRGFV